MSAHAKGSGAAYRIEPKNRYAEATRAIVEHEIRPGNTVTFLAEVDLTEIEQLRASAPPGEKPSYTALVVKAVALSLRTYPYANRRVCRKPWFPFGSRRLQRFECCDVAVAVERDIPGSEATAFIDIVRDADLLPLAQITESLHVLSLCDLSNNTQWRQFSTLITRLPGWLSAWLIRLPCLVPGMWVRYRGGAALVSSPAKYGVDAIVGTWSHPLGVSFGLVRPRPVVREGAVVACPTFTLTLNFDRRVMAGAQAARVFKHLVELLERAGSRLVEPAEAARRTAACSQEPPPQPQPASNGPTTGPGRFLSR